jgi:hypothetical protein
MSRPEDRTGDPPFSKWIKSSTPLEEQPEIVRLSDARTTLLA